MSLDLNKVETPNSNKKKDYGRVADGTYAARVVSVIDLGIQHLTDWQNQKPRYHVLDDEGKWAKKGDDFLFTTEPNEAPDLKPQVLITWELPTERLEFEMEDGEEVSKPRWMSKEYVMSTHEKAGLMALVKAVSPGLQKLGDLVDKPCLLSVGSTKSGNAKITGVAAPMKGMAVGPLESDPIVFSFDESSSDNFNSLHDWIKNKIRKAKNFDQGKFEGSSGDSSPAPSVDNDKAPF